MAPRLFALDQNFPQPLVVALEPYFRNEVGLVPVLDVHPTLAEVEDWELLLALHHHSEPWDGLITMDARMTRLPRELAVIHQTRLTLVAIKGAGHDPVKATGVLLTNLSHVCAETEPGKPQVWNLGGGGNRPVERPWDYLAKVAEQEGASVNAVWHEERLSDTELARDPLQ